MTTKSDYNLEEWRLLKYAGMDVGIAVAFAAWSGPFGTLKELFYILMAGVEGKEKFHTNELIRSVWKEAEPETTREKIQKRLQDTVTHPPDTMPQDEASNRSTVTLQAALNVAAQVADLLERKAPPEEGNEFKQWLLFIGETVASSAKEGSFLGIGGSRVSPEEKAALEAIANALRVVP